MTGTSRVDLSSAIRRKLEATTGALPAPLPAGRYDSARRRRSLRRGRERGCSVYISAAELQAAGIDLDGPAPWYRVWPGNRGGVTVQFYKEG